MVPGSGFRGRRWQEGAALVGSRLANRTSRSRTVASTTVVGNRRATSRADREMVDRATATERLVHGSRSLLAGRILPVRCLVLAATRASARANSTPDQNREPAHNKLERCDCPFHGGVRQCRRGRARWMAPGGLRRYCPCGRDLPGNMSLAAKRSWAGRGVADGTGHSAWAWNGRSDRSAPRLVRTATSLGFGRLRRATVGGGSGSILGGAWVAHLS